MLVLWFFVVVGLIVLIVLFGVCNDDLIVFVVFVV